MSHDDYDLLAKALPLLKEYYKDVPVWVVEEWYCGNFEGIMLFEDEQGASAYVKYRERKGDGQEAYASYEQAVEATWE